MNQIKQLFINNVIILTFFESALESTSQLMRHAIIKSLNNWV